MKSSLERDRTVYAGWRFKPRERLWLLIGAGALVVFGLNLEKRTALRHEPMTDLGVFACASWAVWHTGDLYGATDWHGWHYQYPPALAILFSPLAHPAPEPLPKLAAGECRATANTPWGYGVVGRKYYGLHPENVRFFVIVGIWFLASVLFVLFSAHALACCLERAELNLGLPSDPFARKRWWALRLLPLLACAGSIGTDWSRGQVDVLMLAVVALSLYLACSRRDLLSGVCLAFPATVKIFPAVVLLYPFWRRRWLMAAGTCLGLVFFLVLLPSATLGAQKTAELYRTWSRVLLKPGLGQGEDKSRAKELTAMNSTDNQSLLAAIHNWTYHSTPRRERPSEASPGARHAVYVFGALLLALVVVMSGIRGGDSPRELLLVTGLLLGASLVISPVAHNYYYLLMLPLVAALIDCGLPRIPEEPFDKRILASVAVFTATDFLVRLPLLGDFLRDLAAPLLSLLYLLGMAVVVLWRCRASPVAAASF